MSHPSRALRAPVSCSHSELSARGGKEGSDVRSFCAVEFIFGIFVESLQSQVHFGNETLYGLLS